MNVRQGTRLRTRTTIEMLQQDGTTRYRQLSLANHAYIIVPHSSLHTLVPDRIDEHPCKQCRGEWKGADSLVWATCKRSWTCYLHSLILTSSGGMGKAATVFYKRLTSMLSEKRGIQYSKMMGWLHCQLSFALLQCSIMCIRAARSFLHYPATESI